MVPLPVLMKDEKKYADVVDVLDQLKKFLSVTKHGSSSEPSVNQTLDLRSIKIFRIA